MIPIPPDNSICLWCPETKEVTTVQGYQFMHLCPTCTERFWKEREDWNAEDDWSDDEEETEVGQHLLNTYSDNTWKCQRCDREFEFFFDAVDIPCS